MMAIGHSLSGALLCGLVGPMLPSPMSPVIAVVVSAAAGFYLALVMDLDTKGKAYYALIPLSWILKPILVGLSRMIYHATAGPKDPRNPGMHRMFTHQPEFALLLAVVVLAATWDTGWVWWATGITYAGVWSHRPGDACTKAGVPVSLTRVIIRRVQGEQKVWLRVGIPKRLRFITGGKRGVVMFGAKSRRLWDDIGEKSLTTALGLACCGLAVLTVAGWYPLW